MNYFLSILADTNDADYIHRLVPINYFDITLIRKIAKAIKESGERHNWNRSEYKRDGEKSPEELYDGILTKGEIAFMDELAPYCEYGFHSIKEIKLLKVESSEALLEVF